MYVPGDGDAQAYTIGVLTEGKYAMSITPYMNVSGSYYYSAVVYTYY